MLEVGQKGVELPMRCRSPRKALYQSVAPDVDHGSESEACAALSFKNEKAKQAQQKEGELRDSRVALKRCDLSESDGGLSDRINAIFAEGQIFYVCWLKQRMEGTEGKLQRR